MRSFLFFFFAVAGAMEKDVSLLPESAKPMKYEKISKEAVALLQNNSIQLLHHIINNLDSKDKNQTVALGDERIDEYLADCKNEAKNMLKNKDLILEDARNLKISLHSINLAYAINYTVRLSHELQKKEITHNNNA